MGAAARRLAGPGVVVTDLKSLLRQQRTVPGYVIECVCKDSVKLTQARRDLLEMRTVINRVLAPNSSESLREGSANQPRTAWTSPEPLPELPEPDSHLLRN